MTSRAYSQTHNDKGQLTKNLNLSYWDEKPRKGVNMDMNHSNHSSLKPKNFNVGEKINPQPQSAKRFDIKKAAKLRRLKGSK